MSDKADAMENICLFRTYHSNIRVWMTRDPEGPSDLEDHEEIRQFIEENRYAIDKMEDRMEACLMLAGRFPRLAAVEVMDGGGRCGSLYYAQWP